MRRMGVVFILSIVKHTSGCPGISPLTRAAPPPHMHRPGRATRISIVRAGHLHLWHLEHRGWRRRRRGRLRLLLPLRLWCRAVVRVLILIGERGAFAFFAFDFFGGAGAGSAT